MSIDFAFDIGGKHSTILATKLFKSEATQSLESREKEVERISVTQKDIARHLGVSRSTVLHALNGVGNLSQVTRERVLQAARELGYRPNPVARALVSGKTNTIAFWFYPLLTPFSMMMVNKLQMMVSPYSLVVTNLGLYKPSAESHAEEFPPGEWPVDGIIAFRTGSLPQWVLEAMEQIPPLVYIGYDSPPALPSERIDTVLVKMYHGAEAAIRHLVATRKRVAMLCVESIPQYGDGRALAYENVMREMGREPEYILVPLRRPYRAIARETLVDYVRQHGCPDAIFCASDEQSTAINGTLQKMGYQVPEDVAIVGFDNLEETEYHVPPLSTIAQPFEEMCTTAWEFLQKRIAEPNAPRQFKVVNTQFLPRESSAPIKAMRG